ncbi:MAG: NAD(P)/FAD-dependent oxidoreductase [Gaiellaceae bacterium]
MRAIVVGLGVMGLPTARVLAERGHDVVGVDQATVGAAAGSSSGDTRIFRVSHADRELTRLAVRALDCWRELEARAGEELILMRGQLERGEGAVATAATLDAEGIPYRSLESHETASLFPELVPRTGVPGFIQADAGTILAERSLQAELSLARAAGAELAEGERVTSVTSDTGRTQVATDQRTLEADVVVVCAGPWSGSLLEPLGVLPPLWPVEAQVTYFASSPETFERPCLVDWHPEIDECFYGMPTPRGYKFGSLDWTRVWGGDGETPVNEPEVATLAALVRSRAPELGDPTGSQACPMTLTADGKFILDRRDSLVIGGGCCGQGFKFMPLIGELLADLVEDKPRDPLMEQFRLDRPGLQRQVSSIRDLILHEAPTADAT